MYATYARRMTPTVIPESGSRRYPVCEKHNSPQRRLSDVSRQLAGIRIAGFAKITHQPPRRRNQPTRIHKPTPIAALPASHGQIQRNTSTAASGLKMADGPARPTPEPPTGHSGRRLAGTAVQAGHREVASATGPV